MPRADDLPSFAVDHSCVTPCTHNPLGVKGCGEAGAIGSPPALVNAVLDALNAGGFDVAHIDMPLSPARVWAAMQAARVGRRAMYAFEFVRPTTVEEAVAALAAEEAQALGGGQTLIPTLKQRLASPGDAGQPRPASPS